MGFVVVWVGFFFLVVVWFFRVLCCFVLLALQELYCTTSFGMIQLPAQNCEELLGRIQWDCSQSFCINLSGCFVSWHIADYLPAHPAL